MHLNTWQKAMNITGQAYIITSRFPAEEKYGFHTFQYCRRSG